ncbi:MAG: T9SS type A sorting domain-containing protein [Flavobacteriales bacterium]|nr:T9SS type A sorting domain-containing protein [Flavobacteriales bacterium]
MKKAILLSAALATISIANAQTDANAGVVNMEDGSHLKAIDGSQYATTPNQSMGNKQIHAKSREEVYDFVRVGNTFYDLQTNAAIGRRAILHDDGTITVAWTFSGTSSTTWPDRGSAVNYFDGTDWGAEPTVRTENNVRTGWPSIGVLADGSVYTIAHDAADGGLVIASTSAKGGSTWTTGSNVVTNPNGNLIWNRTANNGDIMHTLVAFSAQSGDPDVIINGITNPVLYSRSLDAGKTWSTPTTLPGYDSSRYLDGDGDVYAIDTRDSVVAMVIGGRYKDVTMWKSMDNGDNWTVSIIDTFEIPRFVWGRTLVDVNNPYLTNDGAVDILIDNNNNVHVVTGRVSYADDDTTDDLARSGSLYNLFHWSENEPIWKVCGTPIDMDGANGSNGSPYEFADETTNSMDANGNPNGGLSYAARYGGTSLSTHPSLSCDASNNIYVTYDCPVEFTYHDFGANFRDVHISFSTDGGANWAIPQNATQLRKKEAVFACMTKKTDDFVHFIFQVDEHPGTNLQNSGSGNLHPNVENTIFYAAIPVTDLMAGNIGQNTLGERPIEKDAKVFVVSQNQPNPFSAETNVMIYLRSGSDLSYTITDATGKVVATQNLGYNNAGNHNIVIDGNNLTSGVYFYTISSKDNKVTKSMQVVK